MASHPLKIPRLNVEESAQDKVLGGASSNQSQGDDFEYDRIARDPSEERTKRRDTDPPPSDTIRPPVMTTAAALHDDEDGSFAQTSAYIYQRKMGGWNARIPEVDIEEQEKPQTSEVKRTSTVEHSSTMKLKLGWNIKDARTKRQKLTLSLGQEPIIRSRSTNSSRGPGWKDTSLSASASVRGPQGYQAHSRPNDPFCRGSSRGRPSLQLQSLIASGRRDTNGGLPSRGHVSPASPVNPSTKHEGAAELQPTQTDDNGQSHESDFDVAPHVLWCHVKDRYITLDKLLDEVRECRAHGLTETEYGLTKRLKAKLETISERNFVGGRYLKPLTLRYDSQDVSKYSVDKTCIFFSFPYLCVAPKSLRQYKEAGDPAHPARTLLQSHYHLNKTTDRDNLQCITWLQPGKLQKYITAVGRDITSGLSLNAWSLMGLRSKLKQWHSLDNPEELFYVPQYWGLIVGLDNLITSSTCGDEDLRGGRIDLSRDAIHDRVTSFSLLRILFYRKDCLEELVFPLDQCDSYFGLLNKQQRILDLSDEEKNPTTEGDDHGTLAGETTGTKTVQSQQEAIRNPKDHPLWHDDDGQRINFANWASIVEAARDKEVLTLRMQPTMPAVVCGHDESPVNNKDSNNPVFGTPLAPVITPFLQWPMLDEFGDRENNSTSVSRVSKFLRAIELHLPIKNRMTAQERARSPQHASERRSQEQSAVHISPKNLESLQADTEAVCRAFEVAKLLLERSVELLGLFVDSEMLKPQCKALEIYWGAVYQILLDLHGDKDLQIQLTIFVSTLELLTKKATQIHIGVRRYQDVPVPGANGSLQKQAILAGGTVLLSALVDALGSIFHMFVEAVRYSESWSNGKEVNNSDFGSEVTTHQNEALKYLQTAKNQLIRVANGDKKSETLAPTLTPEGIAISTMERLTLGMYQDRTLDVVGMYQECLENLTLQVKYEASRRLLQRINEYTEEVKIVIDVLKQQSTVLHQFQKALNPDTFKAPSLTRKLRFGYERTSIKRLLLIIDEQFQVCSELRNRAEQLSIENVQLVETLQDDNSKAIFIFTAVTILFLPASFVAGFFGMNLKQISDTTSDVALFWKISGPLTIGILLVCMLLAIKGEDIKFGMARLWRRLRGIVRRWG